MEKRAEDIRTNTKPEQIGVSARVGVDILPWLTAPMSVPVEHLNHGSSMVVAWATATHPVFEGIYTGLTPEEKGRIKDQVRIEAHRISSDGMSKNAGVLSAPAKPNVYDLPIGHPNDPNRLTAFYVRGQWMGRQTVYFIAGGRISDAEKVRRTLGPDYKPTKRSGKGTKSGHGIRR